MPSRRRFLAALGVSALGGFAGCSASADEPPAPATPDLNPEKDIYGADGNWSSFGCNAGNTRSVHGITAGKAPVDGVDEEWRVPVTDLQRTAPVVAGSRVYLPTPAGLRVYDAEDGTELWREDGIEGSPVVRGGTVFAADSAENAVRALAADSGDERWSAETDVPPVGPSMYPGTPLIVGAGERVFGLNPESGETVWSRRLFGTVLPSPPVWNGYAAAVATEAGEVAVLTLTHGTGVQRFRLPAPPVAPPSADTDSVYVTCRDGVTYALGGETSSSGQRRWSVKTGWGPGGIGLDSGLVFAGMSSELHAVDSESGSVRWTHRLGNRQHTAPAIGRGTLFVGGDRLWALDPTPKSGLVGSGPAVRYERTFHGRVGPGPILHDGTLYVVAETGPDSTHLLALS
ncbi:PQQ-binding-like beta-propeller repeat protein [Haloarcula pellucida]|uniref:Pyrrolo-quinoline quinone repeat domain-containing protein n=1 Tax=Haloarcula pellucida TaxID=1427151 RepID=A0A830GKU1_9EURY|nr:PQQ-binding-like beta-propeller repeat protein [Halomicroarcula pellucida]MBX0349774.1 PQQ-like beta-propeller repeat protein [Halomicroarcula pellucida]GGN94250.1 hypothetical protein GCM10009030_20450 [Halomicroarcula pellucida]